MARKYGPDASPERPAGENRGRQKKYDDFGGLAEEQQFNNTYFTEMCSSSEEGSYSRLKDFCITQI